MVTKEQVVDAIIKLIFLVLITLRACGVIDWAWYLILSPYFAGIVLAIVFSVHKDIKEQREKKIDAAVSAILESRKNGEFVTHLSDIFTDNEFRKIMQKVNSKTKSNGGNYDDQTNFDK